MIQRLQSLYLSLTIILSFLFLKGSYLTFINQSGSIIKVTFSGIISNAGGQGNVLIEKLLPLSLFIIIIPILSLITIIIYKNRKIQIILAITGIILSAAFISIIAFYSYSICVKYNTELVPGWKIVLPFLILIFYSLAYRGIRKDDQLVKSYDRIR